MMHLRRWNLRVGNHYLYDVGREFFEEHVPFDPEGRDVHGTEPHVYLTTEEDLLRVRDPERIRLGTKTEKQRLVRWAETLLRTNRDLMREDRVFDR